MMRRRRRPRQGRRAGNRRSACGVAGPDISLRSHCMTVNLLTIQPLVALIAGILILVIPRLLNYIVAVYLIVVGITGLVH
jgi:hypothetical protein